MHSVWAADPTLADQLTQKGNAGNYQIMLPKDFTPIEPPPNLPGNIKVFSRWKQESPAGEIRAILAITLFSDEKLLKEATQNMRQALVNNSAGMANGLGVTISKREPTETGVLDGLKFFRFKWSGATQNEIPVSGLIYGAIQDRSVLTINALSVGADEKAVRLLDTSIASLKNQGIVD